MQNWGKEGGDEIWDPVPTSFEISFRLAAISNYSRNTSKCDSETQLTFPLIFPTNWLILKKSGKTNKVRSYIYSGQGTSVPRTVQVAKGSKAWNMRPTTVHWQRRLSKWAFKGKADQHSSHTFYLSFFLHRQNFWRIKFTPKNRVNYDKIHSKLPIFCVITAKYTVDCQFFALNL